MEAKWRAQREASLESGYYASSYSGWLSYGTSLVTNIVENLELKIRNVHIRYEDALTISDQRFSCGITIDSLTARSCDANWLPGFSSTWSQTSASFKLIELTSMSIYWQPLVNDETFASVALEDLAGAFGRWKSEAGEHQYIVSPVSATAKFRRDRSEMPLRTRSRPRLTCDLVLNEVQLTLSDVQYKQMVECIRGLDDIAKHRRFHLLRPEQSVRDAPRAWWIYAARCNGMNMLPRQNTHENILENLAYIRSYTKLIQNPNETLSAEQKELKEKVEKERSYYELKFLREVSNASTLISFIIELLFR